MLVLKRVINFLYLAAGGLAAISLIAILVLILAQIIARLFNTHIPSSGDFIAYAIVWTTFLGLPYTMQARGHIRVELFISRLVGSHRRKLSFVIGLFATLMLGIFAYYVMMLLIEAFTYSDVTDGEIPMPLWLVQLPMAIGSILFTLSMLSTTLEDFLNEQKPIIIDD